MLAASTRAVLLVNVAAIGGPQVPSCLPLPDEGACCLSPDSCVRTTPAGMCSPAGFLCRERNLLWA
jgi:hypothetical protein